MNFPGRVGLQQRVLPAYRAAFFDRLAEACRDGLFVYAGTPRPQEAILTTQVLRVANFTPVRNLHILRGELYLCLQPGLVNCLKSTRPDVLIVEANPRYLSNLEAVGWMHSHGGSALGWGLGAASLKGLWNLPRRWLRGRLLRRFDGLIAYSSLGAEQYRAAGVPEDRVCIAPNAVSPPPGPLPTRLPLAGRPPRLLFVGRLQARKRVDLLLRACAALKLAPKPELWIVGDGPARPALERLARSIYPSANFTGPLHGVQLERAFAGADLFVLPGTGGLAVQQAMGFGLPVIVSQADGTQSDLVGEENGWLTPPNDLTALVEAIQQALQDPARLLKKGAASHRVVVEEVNIDRMVSVFVRALNAVLEGS